MKSSIHSFASQRIKTQADSVALSPAVLERAFVPFSMTAEVKVVCYPTYLFELFLSHLVPVGYHMIGEAPAHFHAAKSDGGHFEIAFSEFARLRRSPFADETTRYCPSIFRAMFSIQGLTCLDQKSILRSVAGCRHRPPSISIRHFLKGQV